MSNFFTDGFNDLVNWGERKVKAGTDSTTKFISDTANKAATGAVDTALERLPFVNNINDIATGTGDTEDWTKLGGGLLGFLVGNKLPGGWKTTILSMFLLPALFSFIYKKIFKNEFNTASGANDPSLNPNITPKSMVSEHGNNIVAQGPSINQKTLGTQINLNLALPEPD